MKATINGEARELPDDLTVGALLEQLGDKTYAEYYQPMTGAPLGSLNQSWTAAAALDWLLPGQ